MGEPSTSYHFAWALFDGGVSGVYVATACGLGLKRALFVGLAALFAVAAIWHGLEAFAQ